MIDDIKKTKPQLIKELEELREDIAELKSTAAGQKKVEAALRKSESQLQAINNNTESEAYYHAIFNSSMDMIISVDVDRNIVEFNPAAEKTFGYKRRNIRQTYQPALYRSFQWFTNA